MTAKTDDPEVVWQSGNCSEQCVGIWMGMRGYSEPECTGLELLSLVSDRSDGCGALSRQVSCSEILRAIVN